MSYRKAALKILNRLRATFGIRHTYRRVSATEFPHLDLGFYNRTQRKLQALGFVHIADIEDELIKQQSPDPRTFVRIMSSRDGTVNAAIFHIHPSLPWRIFLFIAGIRTLKIVEFQTELANGAQISTTPVRPRDLVPCSPMVFQNFLKYGLPPEDIYQSHIKMVRQLENDTEFAPKPNLTLSEILEFENRGRKLHYEHLRSIGWVTIDYLTNQANGDKYTARKIFDQVQLILAEEAQAESSAALPVQNN